MKLNENHCVSANGVLLCGTSGGVWGSSVPYKYGKSREVGGGVLSEIPSVVGYGYFLEPHISRSNLQASETECCCKSVLVIEKPDLAKTT